MKAVVGRKVPLLAERYGEARGGLILKKKKVEKKSLKRVEEIIRQSYRVLAHGVALDKKKRWPCYGT